MIKPARNHAVERAIMSTFMFMESSICLSSSGTCTFNTCTRHFRPSATHGRKMNGQTFAVMSNPSPPSTVDGVFRSSFGHTFTHVVLLVFEFWAEAVVGV